MVIKDLEVGIHLEIAPNKQAWMVVYEKKVKRFTTISEDARRREILDPDALDTLSDISNFIDASEKISVACIAAGKDERVKPFIESIRSHLAFGTTCRGRSQEDIYDEVRLSAKQSFVGGIDTADDNLIRCWWSRWWESYR